MCCRRTICFNPFFLLEEKSLTTAIPGVLWSAAQSQTDVPGKQPGFALTSEGKTEQKSPNAMPESNPIQNIAYSKRREQTLHPLTLCESLVLLWKRGKI